MKKHLASLILLGIICTVNYPDDCIVTSTKFDISDTRYRAEVLCTYKPEGSLSRTLYLPSMQRIFAGRGTRVERVDYVPSADLTDTATITCQ